MTRAARTRRRGHRARPHTADAIVEAWGPTREECLEEAVLGAVSSFADPRRPRPEDVYPLDLEPATDDELLVALLDEVIYVVDTLGAVPVAVELRPGPDGGLTGRFGIVPADHVEVTGALPKGISRSELFIGHERGRWRCHVEIDV